MTLLEAKGTQKKSKTAVKGFTLIELTVGIAVFSLVIVAVGQTMFFVKQDSRKQKSSMVLLQNSRWAMEFAANELRGASSASVSVTSSGSVLDFINSSAAHVWYWRGDAGSLGNSDTLYRGTGADLNTANANRRELARFLADNPDMVDNSNGSLVPDGLADPIFIKPAGSYLVYLELNFRPNPALAEGPGNLRFTVMSQVRPRNS